MKAKNFCLIVFVILMMAVFFTACAQVTGPDDPQDLPKDINVSVKYVRIEPYYPQQWETVALNWTYGDMVRAADMAKESENIYVAGSAAIKTKTEIKMKVMDVWKPGYVCKRLFVNGTELIFNGSEYGEVVFILHNDGTIEITSPK